jgi:hypothetical protein
LAGHSDSSDYLRGYKGPPFTGVYLDSCDTEVPGFDEVLLKEAQLVQPHLAEGVAILIDDSPFSAGQGTGKGRRTIPWLLNNGWHVAYAGVSGVATA